MISKEKEWILSVSLAQHDASITLLHGSEIILYIQEERICKIKHDGTLPLLCLHLVKEYTDTIDSLLMVNTFGDKSKIIINHMEKLGISVENILTDEFHHLHHAACGFYGSGFDEAICLVMDGWGSASRFFYSSNETQRNRDGGINCDETTSIFKASYPGNFSVLYKNLIYDPYRTDCLNEIDCSYRENLLKEKTDGFSLKKFFESNGEDVEVSSHFDIGVMYGVVSSFLGFSELECGKIMGLASYGENDESIPPFFCNDQLKCNMNLFSQSRFINTFNYPHLEEYLNSFKKKANIAYAVQDALEKKFEQRIRFIDENYSCKNIVLSGGCAFNVVGNSYLAEKFPHMNFYVDICPNDSGQSLGKALLHYYSNNPNERSKGFSNAYFGPEYDKEDLRNKINSFVESVNFTSGES